MYIIKIHMKTKKRIRTSILKFNVFQKYSFVMLAVSRSKFMYTKEL